MNAIAPGEENPGPNDPPAVSQHGHVGFTVHTPHGPHWACRNCPAIRDYGNPTWYIPQPARRSEGPS